MILFPLVCSNALSSGMSQSDRRLPVRWHNFRMSSCHRSSFQSNNCGSRLPTLLCIGTVGHTADNIAAVCRIYRLLRRSGICWRSHSQRWNCNVFFVEPSASACHCRKRLLRPRWNRVFQVSESWSVFNGDFLAGQRARNCSHHVVRWRMAFDKAAVYQVLNCQFGCVTRVAGRSIFYWICWPCASTIGWVNS